MKDKPKNNGVKWNREETILALDLYCRIPFNKISTSNEEVQSLARLLERTPGSVALKMQNLAHHDPNLRARNIKAMANGSKLDKEVFEYFQGDWNNLAYQARVIEAKYRRMQVGAVLHDITIDIIPEGTYKEGVVKQRIGQKFFRDTVLSAYNHCCCITGIDNKELLIASHIKPWKVSNEISERTNPCNGLSLNALHDKAFDRGLITISQDYRIVISKSLMNSKMDDDTKRWMNSYKDKEIILPERFLPGKEFIEYHNDVIFIG